MRPYLFSLIILITTLRNIKIFSSNTLIYLINHYVKEHFLSYFLAKNGKVPINKIVDF